VRTAIGVGVFTFYFLLLVGGADDVLANFFHVSFEDIIWALRIGVIVMPFVTGLVTWKACKEMSRQPPRAKWPRHVIVERAELGYYASTGGLPVPKEPEPEPFDVRAAGDRKSEEAQRRDIVAVEESRRHLPIG
jgi:hypothetical protein